MAEGKRFPHRAVMVLAALAIAWGLWRLASGSMFGLATAAVGFLVIGLASMNLELERQ
jgi:hypothetical protein